MFSNGNASRAILLVALVTIAYLPAILKGGMVWDDDAHVAAVEELGDSAPRKIWTEPGSLNQYYPMTYSSFWLENRIWKLKPSGYHLTNVLLHGANSALLWSALSRLSVPYPFFIAAVFALHPVNVESVAWISERKNVLSGFFYLLSLLACLRFFGLGPDSSGSRSYGPMRPRQWTFYFPALFFFLCALGSKTVVCTLPAAVLVILYWKNGRLAWRDAVPLVPFFAAGAVLGAITARLERGHIVKYCEADCDFSFPERFLIAGRALWFYFGKILYPANLTFTYPRWEIDPADGRQYLFPLSALAVMGIAWLARNFLGRGPLAGVLYFSGTLFPALGFVSYFPLRYSFVADHFQYLAGIGALALLASLLKTVLDRIGPSASPSVPQAGPLPSLWGKKRLAAALALVLLGSLTWDQSRAYQSEESLYLDTLAKNPGSWMPLYNLGNARLQEGNPASAAEYFREALQHKKDFGDIYANFGVALHQLGKAEDAERNFREALRLKPRAVSVAVNLGLVLFSRGKTEEAREEFEKILQLEPGQADALFHLGNIYLERGEPVRAADYYGRALKQNPAMAEAHRNMGIALARLDRPQESALHRQSAQDLANLGGAR
ncbi:MAG: tetratricopeptide repeat protein [Nitrospinae bacterium]|nr:tetratricopeptide repeat protein [Nitrospinota bacterium]